jgi:hypothetical protein
MNPIVMNSRFVDTSEEVLHSLGIAVYTRIRAFPGRGQVQGVDRIIFSCCEF